MAEEQPKETPTLAGALAEAALAVFAFGMATGIVVAFWRHVVLA